MPKVKKSNNKFYVLIPPEIIEAVGIKEGEELEFSRKDSGSFVVSRPAATAVVRVGAGTGAVELNDREIAILMKLDTMRYNERTKEKADALLSAVEKGILAKLVEKKFVTLYRKDQKEPYRYGIAKSIYEKFLMGKRQGVATAPQTKQVAAPVVVQQKPPERKLDKAAVKKWEERSSGESGYIDELETKGFVVLKNEADAASASAGLEDSIRQGLVVGTRAFDKKFYIGLRGFVNKNGPKIMKALEKGKSMSADEIASEVGIESDGVKTVLYILAESGDVTEVRREIFKLA